ATPVIGFLHHTSPDLAGSLRTAIARGLMEAGFIEGQNVRIEYRWAENNFERLPELAADLVRREVAVIFTTTPFVTACQSRGSNDTNRVPECGRSGQVRCCRQLQSARRQCYRHLRPCRCAGREAGRIAA